MKRLSENSEKTEVVTLGLAKNGPFSTWLQGFSGLAPEPDADPLCWRCEAPDSEHSWYGGITYCEGAFTEDEGEERIDLSRTFQGDPSEISDEELIRREFFLRDVRDWML